jgi:hypothetical protein
MICFDRVFSSLARGSRIVAVFYCKCKDKKRFWAEFWWKPDEDKHEWLFLDDDTGSGSYGERVTRCSGCGEPLHRGTLTPA